MTLEHRVEQLEGSYCRVGCIGDVHCEDLVLERILAFFADARLDLVVCVGDLMDGLGDADRTISLLREHRVHTVRGNHDRWFLTGTQRDLPITTPPTAVNESSRKYLEQLPVSLDFETPRGLVKVCHGLGDNDMLGIKPDDHGYSLESEELIRLLEGPWRWVINGHTHQLMLRQFALQQSVVGNEPIEVPAAEASLGVLNAGTLLRGYPQGFAIVDFSHGDAPVAEIAQASALISVRPAAGHVGHWSLPPGPDGSWVSDGSGAGLRLVRMLALD
ncbi:MAG: metallophosphoesterase family protein [Polyangiaceae bacterium]|nr:metallophosphoesterase family protein [Polyangiaceae bacterium]MCB9607248.1 metallophosphoesterase family protein [Polyangiaceae bacterium]